MADLPYPIDDTRTHCEGCYRTPRHHNCAVVEVDRLRAENERLRKALNQIVAEDVGPTDGSAQEVLMECQRIAMDALEATDDS